MFLYVLLASGVREGHSRSHGICQLMRGLWLPLKPTLCPSGIGRGKEHMSRVRVTPWASALVGEGPVLVVLQMGS